MKKFILIALFIPSIAFSQWVQQNPLTPAKKLYSASFIDIITGWAVGDSGTIIKTTNGGLNWEYHNLINRMYLFGVKFISSTTGYIAADSGRVYKTTDGGNSWVYYSTGTYDRLLCISFPDVNTGYCAGWQHIFKTTNAGINWSITNPDNPSLFYSIFFINPLRGWACGGNTLFKTTNGGLSWDTTYPTGLTAYPQNLFFIDANTGWVTHDQSSAVSRTTDGGYSFVLQYNGQGYMVNSLYFINSSTGWAAGDIIIKTTNGGNNWFAQTPPYWGSSTILFPSSTVGYAIGTIGSIAKTDDGINWKNISISIFDELYKVQALNSNLVFTVGDLGTIAKTTNGGTNWARKQSNSLYQMFDLCFINDNTGWVAGGNGTIIKTTNSGENWEIETTPVARIIYSVHFINSLTGWAAGDSIPILKTNNGGVNWIPINYGNFYRRIFKIYCLDSLRVFALGWDGTFLRSVDGGLTWLNLDTSTSITYPEIFFLNSSTGWVTRYFNNPLLKTTDGGFTWFYVPTNFISYGFHPLKFFNESTGWGLAGAPCKTTDGGVNWVWNAMNPPSHSMDFFNENTGWTVGDMGDIYKTTNGGLIGIENNHESVPTEFKLYQNYPNPFNPSTKIRFSIPLNKGGGFSRGLSDAVTLKIYDILGRDVATLMNQPLQPGSYEVEWSAKSGASAFSSGIYFYRLTAGDNTASKKMVLLK